VEAMTKESKKELKVKLLLGRGSPRANIINVECWNDKMPCDMILPTFTTEWLAYQQMRNYFLEHEEYTHLVLATDDIVVLPEHVDMLQDVLERNDYPVLSGMMNVEQSDTEIVNLTILLPSKDRKIRAYQSLKRSELPDDIFRVGFSGFPLMAIRRDIIERYDFPADRIFEGLSPDRGASLDLVFCHWCNDNDIPIRVDKRIDMKHLRRSGRLRLKKADRLYFWPENGEKVLLS